MRGFYKNNKILFLLACLVLVLWTCFPLNVKAADVIEDFVDPRTGKTETEYASEDSNGEITITSDMKYSALQGRFVFYLAGSDMLRVTSTAANGMILNSSVDISLPVKGACAIYFNGEEISPSVMNSYSEPGKYEIRANVNGETVSLLSFTIVGAETNSIYSYRMPDGFTIKSLSKNGEAVDFSPDMADLSEEGDYSVAYICNRTNIVYNLDVKIDRTPPSLALTDVNNGVAEGPVDLSDYSKEDKLLLHCNNELINYEEKLTVPGNYRIILSDAAGNTVEYNFELIPYLDTNSKIVIAALIIAVIALITYLYVGKRKLKVR